MSLRLTGSSRSLRTLALLAALVLAGCGGGGTSDTGAGAGTAGTAGPAATTSSFAVGPITGFGSIIVNGIRFDDSAARVTNDDDEPRSAGDLRLGMLAEVEGGPLIVDGNGSRSDAKAIQVRSAIVGPVGAVDAVAKTLVVLGQPVDVTATTVFDARLPAGLGSVVVADVVEVYALLDTSTGRYTATRIEPEARTSAFKLRGVVNNLDPVARTFKIAGETISYAGIRADQVPPDLASGLLVRVKLQTTQASGAWVATRLRSGVRPPNNHDEAELEGLITAFTSTTQFSVDGIAVNAGGAAFPRGTSGIVLGARVEVKGSSSNGVVIATRVSIETEDERRRAGFELHGTIGTLDSTAKTFLLRGVTVNFGAPAVVFKNGLASDLAVGRKVEVKGAPSTDGTRLEATTIKFEN